MSRGVLALVATVALAAATLVTPPAEAVSVRVTVPTTDFATPSTPGVDLPPGLPVSAVVPEGTDAVGLSWSGNGTFALRSRNALGWSDWVPVEAEADHGPDDGGPAPVTPPRTTAGPIWTGPGTTAVEVVASGSGVSDLVVLTSSSSDVLGPLGLGDVMPPTGRAVTPASAWGSPGWSWTNCPEGPTVTAPVEMVIVHHTATTTDYAPEQVPAIIASMHRFHTGTRGWCDLAYQFVVDRFGRTWEGRSGGIALPLEGGHSRGFNRATTGVALIGNFDHDPLPDAVVDALGTVAGWKAAANDFDPHGSLSRVSGGSTSVPRGTIVELPRIAGHRDVSATSCPGQQAYPLLTTVRDAAAEVDAPGAFSFGVAGDTPLVGDWNGDGTIGAAVHRTGEFHLRETMTGGRADRVIRFGLPGDRPVVGDWDGDGTDTVGVERDGSFHLLTANRTPDALGLLSGDETVRPAVPADFPRSAATPISGDWDGDGIDTLGYAAGGDVILFADPAGRQILRRERVGGPGTTVVVGDWDGDGVDDVSAVRDGTLFVPTNAFEFPLPAHRVTPGFGYFVLDWTDRGMPALLSVSPQGRWDPTTPIGR